MENQLRNGAALQRGDDILPAGLPDSIGDFALGVGNVQKQHVVVDIHVDGDGMVAKLSKTGAKVIGVAPWYSSLTDSNSASRQARGKANRADAPDIAPGSVDIVFMDLALHHAPAPSLAILEIKRILKPGGRLVVTDLEKNGSSRSGEHEWQPRAGFYPGDLRHWLKNAGFSNIIVNPVPVGRIGANSGGPGAPEHSGYLMATGTVRPFRPKFKV